jgi:hypothetical protein
MLDMKVGRRYIVTKASDDGTFEVGDHIRLLDDGKLLCQEACGWICPEEVEIATKGMEVQIDKEWTNKQREILIEKLSKLESEAKNEPV